MQIIILSDKSKVRGYLIEYVATQPEKSVFLDLSPLYFPLTLSNSRKKVEKKILTDLESVKYMVRPRPIELLRDLLVSFREFLNFKASDVSSRSGTLSAIIHTSLAAYYGDRDFQIRDTRFRNFFPRYLASVTVNSRLSKTLTKLEQKNVISRVVVYNGRDIPSAVAIRLAKMRKIDTRIIERGSDNKKHQIFEQSPHYHPEWWDLISMFSFEKSEKVKYEILKFQNAKLHGFDSYFDQQWGKRQVGNHTKTLSDNLNIPKDYILFLSSSSIEFSPFSEWNTNLGYISQYESAKDLVEVAQKHNKIVVLRRHPNSVGMDGIDREFRHWKPIVDFENVVYVGPENPISTYELCNNATKVFVWKSSMGYESLLMGKQTFALSTPKWAISEEVRTWSKDKIELAILGDIHINHSTVTRIIESYSAFMALSGTPNRIFGEVNKFGVEFQGKLVPNYNLITRLLHKVFY